MVYAAQEELSMDPNIRFIEIKIHRACDQMQILNDRIQLLQIRQRKALAAGHSAATSSLKIQLQVVSGMYYVYYMYAQRQTEELQITMHRTLHHPYTTTSSHVPSSA